MYQRTSRLSGAKQQELLKLFVAGATARSAASLIAIQPNTAAKFYLRLRHLIASKLEGFEILDGEVEVDESYFGGIRKGQRGRGAAGKVVVFGLLKRHGKVHTVVVPDASSSSLLPIIYEKVRPDSIVYSDHWRAYNALDVSDFHHVRINHSTDFARGRNHINGIENFWSQAKRYLRKFNGIKKDHFTLFLKECEWRFNTRDHNTLLKQLKYWYKSAKH
jgi:transposase